MTGAAQMLPPPPPPPKASINIIGDENPLYRIVLAHLTSITALKSRKQVTKTQGLLPIVCTR